MEHTSDRANARESIWSLRLLGGFCLSQLCPKHERIFLGKRERVLLAYLPLSPDGRAPRRKLASLLWGSDADETSLDNLRVCIWGLRRGLCDTHHRLIISDGEDIILAPNAIETDVVTFRRLARAGDLASLEAAADLYTGEFLDGLHIQSDQFQAWRRDEATRSKNQILEVLMRLIAQLVRAGNVDRAIETGLRVLRIEPFQEETVRILMQLHAEAGRRSIAIQFYNTLADSLRIELKAQPERETRMLLAQITHGQALLEASTTASGFGPYAPSMSG